MNKSRERKEKTSENVCILHSPHAIYTHGTFTGKMRRLNWKTSPWFHRTVFCHQSEIDFKLLMLRHAPRICIFFFLILIDSRILYTHKCRKNPKSIIICSVLECDTLTVCVYKTEYTGFLAVRFLCRMDFLNKYLSCVAFGLFGCHFFVHLFVCFGAERRATMVSHGIRLFQPPLFFSPPHAIRYILQFYNLYLMLYYYAWVIV